MLAMTCVNSQYACTCGSALRYNNYHDVNYRFRLNKFYSLETTDGVTLVGCNVDADNERSVDDAADVDVVSTAVNTDVCFSSDTTEVSDAIVDFNDERCSLDSSLDPLVTIAFVLNLVRYRRTICLRL